MGNKTDANGFCFRAKQFACKVKQRLLQVGKRHIFIDVKSLNLMEEAVGARRDSLVAVYASGTDDADWRLLRRHHACLHRRCVRAEQHVRRTLDEECVLHVARRMVGSEVQSREHVPVVLHFRTVGNRESETREDRDNLIADKRDRMACAERRNGSRTRKVDCCVGIVAGFNIFTQSVDFVGGKHLQLVEFLTDFLLLLIRHVAEIVEKG